MTVVGDVEVVMEVGVGSVAVAADTAAYNVAAFVAAFGYVVREPQVS